MKVEGGYIAWDVSAKALVRIRQYHLHVNIGVR